MHRLIRLRRENLPEGIRAVAWIAVSSVIIWVSNSIGPAQRASAARMALRALGYRRERALVAVPAALGAEMVRRHPGITALTVATVAFTAGIITGIVPMQAPSLSRPPAASAPPLRHRGAKRRVVIMTPSAPPVSSFTPGTTVVSQDTPTLPVSSAPAISPSASASASPGPGDGDGDVDRCILWVLNILGIPVCEAAT